MWQERSPCKKAGSIGKSRAEEMDFWTKEEYLQFLEGVRDKPVSYMAFQLLYWTGARIGELMALSYNDINWEQKTISINKSYQRIQGRDVITTPKTPKSNRVITLQDFLVEDLKEYTSKLYGIMPDARRFQFTKSYLTSEMLQGVKNTGVEKIRLHDLRHSHASLLISKLGAQPLQVAQRLGHERIQTTLGTYSHMYSNHARELANQLAHCLKKKRKAGFPQMM